MIIDTNNQKLQIIWNIKRKTLDYVTQHLKLFAFIVPIILIVITDIMSIVGITLVTHSTIIVTDFNLSGKNVYIIKSAPDDINIDNSYNEILSKSDNIYIAPKNMLTKTIYIYTNNDGLFFGVEKHLNEYMTTIDNVRIIDNNKLEIKYTMNYAIILILFSLLLSGILSIILIITGNEEFDRITFEYFIIFINIAFMIVSFLIIQ